MAHPFVQSLSNAVVQLATLEIVTSVGAVDLTITDPKQVTPGGKAMRTRIDLLQGDIRTEIDPVFLGPEYATVRELHTAREAQGHALIQANVQALQALLKLARELGDNP